MVQGTKKEKATMTHCMENVYVGAWYNIYTDLSHIPHTYIQIAWNRSNETVQIMLCKHMFVHGSIDSCQQGASVPSFVLVACYKEKYQTVSVIHIQA